jgi:uncharacterized protein YjbJ (UPF0337 family)
MADERKHRDDSMAEEAGAFGTRVKGAAKDAAGAITGNRSLEREGERESAEGRARQERNDVMDDDGGTPNRTTSANHGLVTGMYDSPETAGRAYEDLTTRHGYAPDDISVLMSEDTRSRYFGDANPGEEFTRTGGSKAAEGAGIGGGIGMGVGAAIGAIVAAATAIAIPGLGLVVAGPIAGAIAGAGAGGATGTIVGALVGAGIPEERAAEYERGIKTGGIVLGTRARDDAHAASLEKDFTSYGARHVRR